MEAYLYVDRGGDVEFQRQVGEHLILDLDVEGKLVGVESLVGPVTFSDLFSIVRLAKF